MAALRRAAIGALLVGLAVSISLSEIALGVLLVCLLVERRRWTLPLVAPIAAFAAWTIVSALASARPLDSLLAAKGLVWLATTWVVLNALDDRAAAHRFATALFVLIAGVAALAIVQVAACPGPRAGGGLLAWFFHKCERARGFYSIYMTLAGVIAMVLASAVPRFAAGTLRVGTAGVAWLVALVGLGLTYVRSAWVGFVVGSVGALAVVRRRGWPVGLAVLLLALALSLPGVVDRVRTIGSVADDTTRDRLAMLSGGLRMARDHPWLGIGPGQVKFLYPVYAPPEALRRSTSHLHDTPLQILVERGVVGLALWLWLFVAFFRRSVAIYRRLRAREDRALVAGVMAAIVTFLVAGLFEYTFGDTEVLLVACALMSLPFVLDRAACDPADGTQGTPLGDARRPTA